MGGGYLADYITYIPRYIPEMRLKETYEFNLLP